MEEAMGQLTGKVAVVTGGTTGIGLAAAKRFAAEGAQVYVTGRRKTELDAAVLDIGSGAAGIQGDISQLADLDRLYESLDQNGRRIDVLFANAGGGEFATLAEATPEHFDTTFGINVRGLFFTVQKALPLLNDGASVILPGSTAASTGDEAFGVYSATKAAVRSFARTWANELKSRRIRVNVIVPGPIDTPGITGLAPDAEQAGQLKGALAGQVPLGRMGRPDEIASAVLFLASDQSSFTTGAELHADGGMNQV
jgi:NAD(P)-dependent dehydrogenase (short-subunit alcohol dehydrogenase family)